MYINNHLQHFSLVPNLITDHPASRFLTLIIALGTLRMV